MSVLVNRSGNSLANKHKIVFVGDQGTGKTSLVTRMVYDTFTEQYRSTIGIDFLTKSVVLENNHKLHLQLWDTAGQERFRCLIPSYLRDSDVAIVIYDVSKRKSFATVDKWILDVQAVSGRKAMVILVANKVEGVENRQINFEAGEAKASEYGISFIETSAKSGENVKELWRLISSYLYEKELHENAIMKGKSRESIRAEDHTVVAPCIC